MNINESVKNDIVKNGGVIGMYFMFEENNLTLEKVDIQDEVDLEMFNLILSTVKMIKDDFKTWRRKKIKKERRKFRKDILPTITQRFDFLQNGNVEESTKSVHFKS